jgi:hypothetical protein
MPLDSSIILQARQPQLPNPVELAQHAATLRQLGLQSQASQLGIDQAQRSMAQEKTLADLYRNNVDPDTGAVNTQGVIGGMATSGLGEKIPAYQKSIADASKAQTDLQTAQLDLHKKKLDVVSNHLSSLLSDPNLSHDKVIASINDLVNQGMIDPNAGAQMVRQLPGPDQLRPFLMQKGLETMDVSKQLEARLAAAPKYNEQDRGAVINQGTVDPTTGVRTAGTDIAKAMTPDQASKVKLMQDRGTFTATSGDLLAALSAKGISLPAGMRSKEQQIATLNGLIRKYPNLSPDEIADNIGNGQINFGSDKKAATVAAGQEGKVSTAVNELGNFGDQALAASAKVPRGSFIPVNKLLQMADTSISDPNLLTLKLKLNALNNAYNVLSARGGTDAESRHHVAQLFSAATGPEGVEALVKGLKEEAAGAKAAARSASHVETPPAARDPSVPPDIAALLQKHGGK